MKPQRSVEKRLMGDDPLATESILERFYKPEPAGQSADLRLA